MGQRDDVARFFDSYAQTFNGYYTGRRGRLVRWLDHRFRRDIPVRSARTFEGFGDLRGRTVLDIGCGSGPYIIEALKRGARPSSSTVSPTTSPPMSSLARTGSSR